MAIVQDSFDIYPARAYEGQIATQHRPDILSGVAVDTISFGRAVTYGIGTNGGQDVAPFAATSTAAQVIGVSARIGNALSSTIPSVGAVAGGNTPAYYRGNEVAVLRSGAIYVRCVDGAKRGDKVSVITDAGANLGCFSTGKGVILDLAFWRDDTPAGAIGVIELNKNLVAPATK